MQGAYLHSRVLTPLTGSLILSNVISTESSLAITTNAHGPSIDPSMNVETTIQEEERARVLGRLRQVIEEYQHGKTTQFQTLSNIVKELDKWIGVSDKEMGRAFSTYHTEVISV
jgi:hypothetical protein